MAMSIGEVEIRGHMDGFDQGGQAVDRVRDTRPPQRERKDLAHDALAIILAGGRGWPNSPSGAPSRRCLSAASSALSILPCPTASTPASGASASARNTKRRA